LYQKKGASQVKTDQKSELEKQLQQLKEQLQKETDSTKKQELEEKKKNLEQQIGRLGGSNAPSNPNQNPPSKNPPQKTSRQITVEYNTTVGDKHEYVNVNDNKEQVLIDAKNKIFSSGGLTNKNTQYTISFNEEEVTEKKEIKQTTQTLIRYIFDENNDKFQLTPTTPKQKIDTQIRYGGGSSEKGY
jgi:hypothetical protein